MAQDVIVREDDCGTDRGLLVAAIKEGNEVIEALYDRLVGRFARRVVKHPVTGEVIIAEK
ncbi:hypothetical protein GCM10020331_017850 [Ectobacillus funiculus]